MVAKDTAVGRLVLYFNANGSNLEAGHTASKLQRTNRDYRYSWKINAWGFTTTFFGGMLLNIMPCVLPVLSLKLFSLIEQSDITSRQQKIAGISILVESSPRFWSWQSVSSTNLLDWMSDGDFSFSIPDMYWSSHRLYLVILILWSANCWSGQSQWTVGKVAEYFMTVSLRHCWLPIQHLFGNWGGFAFTPLTEVYFLYCWTRSCLPLLARSLRLPSPTRTGGWMDTFADYVTLIATTVWLVDVLGAQTGMVVLQILSFPTSGWNKLLIFGTWGSIIASRKSQITSFLIAVALSTVADFLSHNEIAEPEVTAELSTWYAWFLRGVPWQPFSDDNIAALSQR